MPQQTFVHTDLAEAVGRCMMTLGRSMVVQSR